MRNKSFWLLLLASLLFGAAGVMESNTAFIVIGLMFLVVGFSLHAKNGRS